VTKIIRIDVLLNGLDVQQIGLVTEVENTEEGSMTCMSGTKLLD
jgi:hypothetical protein